MISTLFCRAHRNQPATGVRTPLMRLTAALSLSALLLSVPNASAFDSRGGDGRDNNWVATWGASPQSGVEPIFGPPPAPTIFNDQTVRMIARISKGGDQVRVRLDNSFGADSGRHRRGACRRSTAWAPRSLPGSDRALRFSGRR